MSNAGTLTYDGGYKGPPVIRAFSTSMPFGFSAISYQISAKQRAFVCAQTARSTATNQMFAKFSNKFY